MAMSGSHGRLVLEDYIRFKDLEYAFWNAEGRDDYEAKRRHLDQWQTRALTTIQGWERMGATILSIDDRSMEIDLHGVRRTVPVSERQTRLADFGFVGK
jgi:hypothetical protein